MPTLFLAFPVTANIDSAGVYRAERRAFYAQVLQKLRARDFEVVCGTEEEKWGEARVAPAEFTHFDLTALEQSDALVVVASENISGGLHLEIGFAVAKRIPVFVVVKAGSTMSSMVSGLVELGRVELHRYVDENAALGLVERLEII